MLNSYLLIFIHKFILFALTANAILIFIMYLLNSVFIGIYCGIYFIYVAGIYFHCITTVFIEHVFIYLFIYLLIFIGMDLFFFYSIHVL